MFRKKLAVAGIAAAMTVATGMTAYAGAGTATAADVMVVKTINKASERVTKTANKQRDDQQATKDDSVEIDKDFGQDADNAQTSDKDDNKKTPGEAGAQLGRKSDEEAMKEGNPTPDLPEGVTAEKPDDLPEGTDQKPEEDGQAPSGDNTQTPGEAGEQPGRKSDEEAMKEGNPTPDLPEGVTAEKPDDLPEGTDQKPAGDESQTPSGDNTQAPDQNKDQAPSGNNGQGNDWA